MSVHLDFRSDTVTHPPPGMLRAMSEAELGDDVFRDDPTVIALEEKAAELLGKEAGLLVTSGTQGNLVSMLSHAARGDQILIGDKSHIYKYEAGGASVLGGLVLHPLKNSDEGTLDAEDIRAGVNPRDDHLAPTRLLTIENTHNVAGGKPVSPAQTKRMANAGREAGLKVHLDGARMFNAAISLGVSPAELAEPADSLSFCLSKGLSCPIGSVVVGERDFIEEARRWRKMLGGGMRQAGIVAAAGIYALDHMVERLAEDHENARHLAFGLAELQGMVLDPESIRTNIIYFRTAPGLGDQIAERLRSRGILMDSDYDLSRLVTHYGITREDIDHLLKVLAEVITIGSG